MYEIHVMYMWYMYECVQCTNVQARLQRETHLHVNVVHPGTSKKIHDVRVVHRYTVKTKNTTCE